MQPSIQIPKITVVIPVYNTEAYLARCLQSVAEQTLDDFEALCVDDASTDGSAAIIESLARKDSRFKLIQHEGNQGAGAARNSGLEHAQGEYITFLDSDDRLAPEAFESAYIRCTKANADICCEPIALDWPSDNRSEVYPYSIDYSLLPDNLANPFPASAAGDGAFMFTNASVCTKTFRRSFLERIEARFTDHRVAEDLLFTYTAFAQTERITLLQDCFYYYNQEKSSSVSKESGNIAALVAALDLLYDKLNCLDLLTHYEGALANLFLYHVGGALTLIHDAASLEKAFDVCEGWKTWLKSANFSFLYPHYEIAYRNLCFGSPTSYLLDILEPWRAATQRQEDQITALVTEIKKQTTQIESLNSLQLELDKVTGSRSFRLGTTLLYIPSKIKGKIAGR